MDDKKDSRTTEGAKFVNFPIKTLSTNAFEKFVIEQRDKTIKYLKGKFSSLRIEELEDAYQESSIALWRNFEEGKAQAESVHQLENYFLRININQCLKIDRSKKKTITTSNVGEIGSSIDNSGQDDIEVRIDELLEIAGEDMSEVEEKNEYIRILKEAITGMCDKCRQLIVSHYLDGKKWVEVAEIAEYKNADTAKSAASRCFKELKNVFDKLIKRN